MSDQSPAPPDDDTSPTQFDEHAAGALPAPDPMEPVDRAEVIAEGGRKVSEWSARFLLIAAALGVLGWGLSKVWDGLLPLLLALLISSVLWPVVAKLKKWRVPYGLGALIALLLAAGFVAAMLSYVAPSVVLQWPQLWGSAITGVRRLQDWVAGPPFNVHDDELNLWIDQALNWLQTHSSELLGQAVSLGGSVGSGVVKLLLTLVLTFFFLKDGVKFIGVVQGVVGRRAGFHASELLTRMWNTLSGYIRTQAIVSFVDAFFIGLGLVLLGVPLAMPIAVLTFMAGFIPVVGAVSVGTLAVLVALVSNGFYTALFVLILIIGVQQLEGNVLQPLLQSKVMKLHPVVILISVVLGGVWAGIIGMFLAVPVVAVLAVVFRYLGDLTDLRTGEKVAGDIAWATDEGQHVASESERASVLFRAALSLARLRHDPVATQTPHQATERDDAASDVPAAGPRSATGRPRLPSLPRPWRRRGDADQ